MPIPPTENEIYHVAEKAVIAFGNNNLKCCLFGSAACALYGTTRTPNDVDLIVLTNAYDPEELKGLLVAEDNDFYLRPSRSPRATYEVLFCHLGPRHRRRSCKVDILLPGILNIPNIPRRRIVWINALPVMPLLALLLLKLQGWVHHRESYRQDMQEKQYVDVEDIDELLAIAIRQGVDVSKARWLPRSLVSAAEDHVAQYVEDSGSGNMGWDDIGFEEYWS